MSNEAPTECDCCGWETTDLHQIKKAFPGSNEWEGWVCKVCWSAHLAKAVRYPRQLDLADLATGIAWSVNYLASLIREGRQ